MGAKTTYEAAPAATRDLITEVMNQFHLPLATEEVTVAALVVRRFDKDDQPLPALRRHGNLANAVIRRVPARRRPLVDHDLELELDGLSWDSLSPEARRALVDHELTHVTLIPGKEPPHTPQRDDNGYVRLKLRPDEVCFTGFFGVIERHGEAALEARDFKRLYPLYLSALEAATRRGARKVAATLITG